jgi:hypothetical protein
MGVTTPLDLLQRGDLAKTEHNPVIEFSGRPWFVLSYIGDKAKGAMLVAATLEDQSNESVVRDHMLAAVNLAVMSVDWKEVTLAQVTEGLQGVLADMIESVHRQHMLTQAARKPS